MTAQRSLIIALSLLSLCLPFHLQAKDSKTIDLKPLAFEQLQGTQVQFFLKQSVSNSTLSISGPSGYYVEKSSKTDAPSVSLEDFGQLEDGLYKYQLSAATSEEMTIRDNLDNGRGENARKTVNKPIYQSGVFRVVNGQIAHFSDENEPVSRQDK